MSYTCHMHVIYILCIHLICMVITTYIHVIYMLYTFYIRFIYILYTFYIHLTCTLYILYTQNTQLLHTFLDTFSTLLGHVSDKFGVQNEVFPKSFGDLWAIIWHHRRCLGRGLKILNKIKNRKTNYKKDAK